MLRVHNWSLTNDYQDNSVKLQHDLNIRRCNWSATEKIEKLKNKLENTWFSQNHMNIVSGIIRIKTFEDWWTRTVLRENAGEGNPRGDNC